MSSASKSEPILIGDEKMLKPALRLMSDYRLRIDEIKGAEVVRSFTRWLSSVETIESENEEVFVTFGRSSSAFGWNPRNVFRSTFPGNRLISG
jgi:hypothetical protein